MKTLIALLIMALPLPTFGTDPGVAAQAADDEALPAHRKADSDRMEAFWRQHIAPDGVQLEPQQMLDALHAASERGHPEAQFMLGMILIDSDQEAAREKGAYWFAKAGKQGHAIALMKLGLREIERGDTASALAFFESAAATGEPDANYALGLIYLNGENVDPDPSRAASLFQVAASAGHAEAQMRLAAAYWNGEGRAQNLEEAYFWFRLAAPQSDRASAFLTTAESALEPTQREAARARAASWTAKHYVPAWMAGKAEAD